MAISDYPPLPTPLQHGIYDNHTHLQMVRFGEEDISIDVDTALDLAEASGVVGVVYVGTDFESSSYAVDLAERDNRALAAVALHPNDAAELEEAGTLDTELAKIEALGGHPRVRAFGETGIDFFRTESEIGRSGQIRSFEAHIEWAKRFGKAVQIHDRDAHDEVVVTLKRVGAPEKTVFHCFSGDIELAKICADNGWYTSFAGTVTFNNSKGIQEAAKYIPQELILTETDAPFLAPAPYRGKPNSSFATVYTLRFIAELRGIDAEELAEQVGKNTRAVYGEW